MTTNARAVDLELNTLKNALKFAVRSGRLDRNPMDFRRPAYCRASTVSHCREHAPRSAEELHAHARLLFQRPETEVLGWQMLFEAFTGCRTGEALALRTDAKLEGPGHVSDGVLWLARAKGGCNGFFRIHEALAGWLEAFTSWRVARFPGPGAPIPWFPGPDGQKARTGSLTGALRRSSEALHPGYIVTSHGLRSYYVTVRRSHGTPDAQIAQELGQRTGAGLIIRVYGDNVPRKMGWLPEDGRPAWDAKEAK